MNKKDSNKNSKFSIYRLCRNKDNVLKCEKDDKSYGFSDCFNLAGYDYFVFLNKIIKDCKDDFALVCHDDVILPINIREKVLSCISNANKEFGEDNWGIIGNAGVDFFSGDLIRFLSDPHSRFISSYTSKSQVVIFVDGNTMLLNLRNLRRLDVFLPKNLSGFHLYDFILMAESYNKGLITAVDSSLYVVHKSGGNQAGFNKEIGSDWFLNYWRGKYINNKIVTINGNHRVENNLAYIESVSDENRFDFYKNIQDTVKDVFYNKTGNNQLNIVVRTTLGRTQHLRRLLKSIVIGNALVKEKLKLKVFLAINNTKIDNAEEVINRIVRDFDEIEIISLFCKLRKNQYPRVSAISETLDLIEDDDNSFVWIVDDDDFVFPSAIEFFNYFLDKDFLLIGNSTVFLEKWDYESDDDFPRSSISKNTFQGHNYFSVLSGINSVPVCSVIYPARIIKGVFNRNELRGDYYEDYAIFLLSLQRVGGVRVSRVNFAGISYHGDNTVLKKDRSHWDYSYATFLSEIVNSGFSHDTEYKYMQKIHQEIDKKNGENAYLKEENEKIKEEILIIKNSKFWKLRNFYLKVKHYFIFIFLNPRKFLKKQFKKIK